MKKVNGWKKTILQLFLGAVVGGFLGFFASYMVRHSGYIAIGKFFQTIVSPTLSLVLIGVIILLLFISMMQIVRLEKHYQIYKELDDEDDKFDDLYLYLNKELNTILTINAIVSPIVISSIMLDGNTFEIIIFPYLSFGFMLFVFQLLLFVFWLYLYGRSWKFYCRFKKIDVPIGPSLKELRKNILQQDEAELEVQYRASFDTIMLLRGRILPAFYLLILFISALLGSVEWGALFVTIIADIFIIWMQYKATKNYYR